MERAYVDVPDEFTGNVIDRLSQRKGELQAMTPLNAGTTRLEFIIPARGLIGYRGEFMTDTKGNGVINTEFEGYGPFKGEILIVNKALSLLMNPAKQLPTVFLMHRNEALCLLVPVKKFTAA